MKKKELKTPKTIGACVDLYYNLRAKRLELQSAVEDIKKDEAVLRDHIIDNLSAQDAESVGGKIAKATIKKSVHASAKDWTKIWAYLRRTKNYQIIGKRLNDKACRELWEDKKVIPGVERFDKKSVSLTKK